MKNKKLIKEVLFEGSHQISAVLPRPASIQRERDVFVYKIPILLNKSYFLKNENKKNIDYFKIIFYKQSSFTNDFNSKFYSGTLDYKKYNDASENTSNIFFSENIKKIAKGFYQDGNLKNKHFSVDFRKSNIVDQDLYVYNITLSNAVSKSIIDEDYSCMRIFAVKNNSVVDDTDFIVFENTSFLKEVFLQKKVYDLQYFIDQVYLQDFSKSLNLSMPDIASETYQTVSVNKSHQFDVSITTGDVILNVDFNSSDPITTNSTEMNISTFVDDSIIEITNSSFFENIVKLYLIGLEIFVFKIQCIVSINSELDTSNQNNFQIQRIFEKQVSFSRSDSFITKIIRLYRNQYLTRLYNRLGLSIESSVTSNHIEVVLKLDNDISERQLLSFFRVKSIKNNNTQYFDGELYSSPNFTFNDKINFNNLNLDELTYSSDKTFKFYIPNNSVNIFSKIKIRIGSIDENFDLDVLESDTITINPDYENLFNKLNKRIIETIQVNSNGLNSSAASNDYMTSFLSIIINNLQRRFGDIAYSFGYFDQQDSQNTQSTSDILDFFKSSIFSFELEEKLQNISNCSFKKQNYFFGNQIIENNEIINDSIEIKKSFLFNFLRINTSAMLKNSVVNNTSSQNTINSINSFGKDFDFTNNNSNSIDILRFLIENNFLLSKKLRIKIIPIPKLIKIYQSQTDIDEKFNLVFPASVPDEIKNSINLNFVDLFYDKNSSLNWDRFLRFKSLFFKKNVNEKMQSITDTAGYLSPIWDYLSSEIYIKNSNVFTNIENFNSNDIVQKTTNNSLENFNSKNKLKKILTKSHFEDSNNKYFNFTINNNEFIKILNTGMVINFKSLNSSLNSPRHIEILNTNSNKELRIDLDITALKKYFSINDIEKMNFFVKMSVHPLLRNVSYSRSVNLELTEFINTNIDTSKQFYITQNNNYMQNNLKKYFFEYSNPISNLNSKIYNVNENLILSLFPGKNRKKIDSSTFKELFDFCINKKATILQDFYLRVGFSFVINNNYYCANIYKEIDRNNFNDSLIKINSVESIKEV